MRSRSIVAVVGLAVATALPIVIVACSSMPAQNCKPNTLRLNVQLNLTASLADTITVQSYTAPVFTQSFPRLADGVYGEIAQVDITFPGGYPADKLVTLVLRASAKGQTIGEDVEQIHLLPGCTEGSAVITSSTLDASPAYD
jgi:hypothetical protein